MAGKRKQNDLRGVDKQSSEYWEEVLGRAGFGMSKGSTTNLIYVGNSTDLEYIDGRVRTDDGRVGSANDSSV